MIANDIAPIDLLIVNLYPFEATLKRGASFEDKIENIDIGGPAMIRGAAKNHDDVVVIVDVADYAALLDELDRHDGATEPRLPPPHGAEGLRPHRGLRRRDLQLAGSGDRRDRRRNGAPSAASCTSFGALRYGENPHQTRGALSDRRDAPGRRDRAAGPGQGAVLQQHQRHRCGLRAGRRIRSGGERRGRDHQARQPLRRRRRRVPPRGLREGAGLRSGLGVRRHRGAEPPLDAAPRRRSSRSSPR